jgi:hypothetical protein
MLLLTVRDRTATSSNDLSTLASVSIAQSTAKTRHKVICSVIDMATSSNNNAFAPFLQRRQMAEDLELNQRQLDQEEERAQRKEEAHEISR